MAKGRQFRHLLKDGPESQQFVFNEKRHHLGEFYLFFFSIGKTGDMFSPHQRNPFVLNMAKYPRCVADQCDWLRADRSLDRSEAGRFSEMPASHQHQRL
jgi:hypothetical protein